MTIKPTDVVWCEKCQRGYPLSPILAEDEAERVCREICRRQHGAVLLQTQQGSFRSNRPVTEPVRTSFFWATEAGKSKRWRVKKWRTDINQAFEYKAWKSWK